MPSYNFFELGNLGVIEELLAADYLAHTEGKEYKGYDFIRKYTKQIRSSFTEICVLKTEFFQY